MNIALVSIGEELLKGQIVNTNVAFLGKKLSQAGYTVSLQMTLSDARESLKQGLQAALSSSDLVIATGGLGPTLDDVTRSVAAEIFHCGFREDARVKADLIRRYPENIHFAVQDQAIVPEKATALLNPVGSAPGLIFSENGKCLILLPGVPQEMESLFKEEVFPFVQKQWQKEAKHSISLHFCLIYESLLDPYLRELSLCYPDVDVGIYPDYGTVTVSLSSRNKLSLLAFEKDLTDRFSIYRYESKTGSLSEALLTACVSKNKKLAFAESCTGGSLASAITLEANASAYFLGSMVVYSNAYKETFLGVSSQTLTTKGAVSKETVLEMLDGVFRTTNADIAVAVSGVAGPGGGTKETPLGTIFAAIGERGKVPDLSQLHFSGDRKKIITSSTLVLLGVLWRKIEKGIPAFPLYPQIN